MEQSSNVGFGHDLLKHNLVVFQDGEAALQVKHIGIFIFSKKSILILKLFGHIFLEILLQYFF